MAKKCPIEKLSATISKIMSEYADDVDEGCAQITKKIGAEGAKALKQQSKQTFGGSGKYAAGWRSEVEETRLGTTAIIYNTSPGLPHLLEHGHAKRGGGRVEGRPHIAPVEDQITKQYLKEVESKL